MHIGKRLARDIFDRLPAIDSRQADEWLEAELQSFDRKIIVLDDDPTGVQTVHGISVYTDWTLETLIKGFHEEGPMFFILTNSRGLIASETETVHRDIARHAAEASKQLGNKPYLIVSRGDSTLRGHYPLETETLRSTTEEASGVLFDGEVILPFFKAGGRYTIDNIHYVQYDEELVPVGETEFALDRTFGYTESDLGRWVEEKSGGAFKAADTAYISLDSLRALQLEDIEEQLMNVSGFNKVVVNAVDDIDVKIFTIALVRAMKRGKTFMFRTAAAFTKVIGGIGDRPLLTKEEVVGGQPGSGGLILVGSHVKKTTEQLEQLKTCDFVTFIEFNVHLVMQPDAFKAEIDRVITETEAAIAAGKTVTVYTRRERLDLGEGKQEEELQQSVTISDAVTSIVQRLNVRPKYIIAKGGITSSDIGTKGLRVQRATVAGQIQPGVPVWITGGESKFPGLYYIIFPGNVGSASTLKDTVELLER
ncbi:hydroxyacid dehydrogenase [Paenibacillus sp. 1011MAR3C5]|uniref:four-carbon acid sugar kinase family protein n=1 Tax=Paenibacillus sp. 1011MAR3C5 TaxID=1675787 RepID=UPI000E6B7F22|nr:four-carbon acid sugar kinase family protein [Paenibacillus sp. 1011MAR3C5]RJE90925.1 hydroxyacid dehydrogenase [Paenibacillus sp. 1011MAR3C5]